MWSPCVSECILPGIVADAHRRLTALFGEPHHVQHRHAQTLLLGLVAHWNRNPVIQKVTTPLEEGKKTNTSQIKWYLMIRSDL